MTAEQRLFLAVLKAAKKENREPSWKEFLLLIKLM